MRAAIFIDGGYFLNRLKDDGVTGDVDYLRLTDHLLSPLRRGLAVDLLRSYFYDCPPWASEQPTKEEIRRIALHREFVDEIERTDRWQVRLGKLERRWEGKHEYFEQKRVDVMLSVDLVRHAAAGHIQHAVLLAGDSDFIPAVAAAKESGVTVSLWGGAPKTVHRDLGWIVDELHRFDPRAFLKKPAQDRQPEPGPGPRKSSSRRGSRRSEGLSPRNPER